MLTDKNKVRLCGNLVEDMSVRTTKNGGREYGVISLAVSDEGLKQTNTLYIKILIWNKSILQCYGEYLKEGVKVIINGSLEMRNNRLFVSVKRFNDLGVLVRPKFSEVEDLSSLSSVEELSVNELSDLSKEVE